MIKLVDKEDVTDIVESDDVSFQEKRSTYRDAIENYVEKWKSEIEKSSDGRIVVRIRYIRDNILGKWFKEKTDSNIYNRLRFVLLEYGIAVKLWHHYGANLLMSLAREEDIISDKERNRIEYMKTVKKAGFDRSGDYCKSYPSYEKDTTPCNVDLKCTKYLGTYIEEKLMKIFDNASKNPIATNLFGAGAWDWKCKNGALIKHVSSCYHYNIKRDELRGDYEWEGYHWGIARNKVPHYYLLIGYNDNRENLDIKNAWFVPGNDIIRRRKFWDREAFSIRYDKNDKQIKEMKKYEVGKDKLEKMREIVRLNASIVIDNTMRSLSKDVRDEISVWYRTYFR